MVVADYARWQVSLEQLEAIFENELTTDTRAAAETAYALACRYATEYVGSDGRPFDIAKEWAMRSIGLLDSLPSDTVEQVASTRRNFGRVLVQSVKFGSQQGEDSMSDSTLINKLLADQTYHIEFNGILTNHAKHAVVALAGLGVPPDKIKEYYDNYAQCTPYGFGLEAPNASQQEISEANWTKFLGKRTSFWAYCEFFDTQEKELGIDELLRRYVPPLLPGWVGSLTHAAIHLGWALDAQSRWMTIEGLAYLAFSYVSCHPERTSTRSGETANELAVDSLLRIAGVWEDDHNTLKRWVKELVTDTSAGLAAGVHPELARSGLQYRIARVLSEGHPLINEIPAWIDDQDVATSWEQLYYVVSLAYLAKPGDFVLLHLITSLYGMEQIADRLPAEQQRDVVKCFWIGMLCIIFSAADFPRRKKLAALHSTYWYAVDGTDNPAWQQDWEQIVARATEEEEEHNPKLVYVLQRLWNRTGGRSIYRGAAAQFTATPELPETFEEPPTE